MFRRLAILLFALATAIAASATSQIDRKIIADSLRSALMRQVAPSERIPTLINLADLIPPQYNPQYALQLLDEGRRAHSDQALLVALPKLAWYEMWKGNDEKIQEYCGAMRQELPRDIGYPLATIIESTREAIHMDDSDDHTCNELIATTITELQDFTDDIYNRLRKLNTLIAANDRLYSLNPNDAAQYQREMLRYLQRFYNVADKLPVTFSTVLLRQHALSLIANNPTLDPREKEEVLEKRLQFLKDFYGQDLIKGRPWFPKTIAVSVYSNMLTSHSISEETRRQYLDRCLALIEEDRSNTIIRPAEYGMARYATMYYENKDHLTLDDLNGYIKALRKCIQLGPMSSTITDRQTLAKVYYDMGNYRESTNMLLDKIRLADSLRTASNDELTMRLQTEYDVTRHKLENSELRTTNQRNVIIAGFIFIILLSGLAIYKSKMTQRERRLNQRILESEAMKTAFIRSMCHEIRTPLNIIAGNSQVIAMRNLDPHTKHTMVEGIEHQTELLTKTLDDLLNVSLLDSSDEHLPISPTDLQPELEAIIEKYRFSDSYHTWLLECDDLPTIGTNAQYLVRVVDNLLNNVMMHCPHDTVAKLTGRYDHDAEVLTIACEDNGPGIPADVHDQIFNRFFKVNEFVQGTGLGLYMCKLVVTRLSGRIYIDPDYLQGTRMVIVIPAKKMAKTAVNEIKSLNLQ